MIREVTMYQAVCDGCGKAFRYEDEDKYPAIFDSPKQIQLALSSTDWLMDCDRLYCPDCYEYDKETDSYKPKDKKL